MLISRIRLWFGYVEINFNGSKYTLSSSDPDTLKNKIPMELFLIDFNSIGEAVEYVYRYDNEYRAQKECSP